MNEIEGIDPRDFANFKDVYKLLDAVYEKGRNDGQNDIVLSTEDHVSMLDIYSSEVISVMVDLITQHRSDGN